MRLALDFLIWSTTPSRSAQKMEPICAGRADLEILVGEVLLKGSPRKTVPATSLKAWQTMFFSETGTRSTNDTTSSKPAFAADMELVMRTFFKKKSWRAVWGGALQLSALVRIPYGTGKVALAPTGSCSWTLMKTPVAGNFGAAEARAARKKLKKMMDFIFAWF